SCALLAHALTARCAVMVWWFGWPPSGSAPASGRECATSPPRHLTRRRRWLSEGKPGRASQPCGGLGWKRRQPPNIACCAASRRAARTTCPFAGLTDLLADSFAVLTGD